MTYVQGVLSGAHKSVFI